MNRLRFSIRDLLWLTTLCAVLVAWWIDRSDVAEQRDQLVKAIKQRPVYAVPLTAAQLQSRSIRNAQRDAIIDRADWKMHLREKRRQMKLEDAHLPR
jgi:hypothetical protein